MGGNLGICVCLIALIIINIAQITPSLASKAYIVYMGSPAPEAAAAAADPSAFDPLLMLATLHGGSLELAQASHLYTYRHSFRGFAAKLTLHQASQISRMPGVISVFPNTRRSLHTTHSWDFMGLFPDESMEIPGFSTTNQHNVIIGFIDTGIWPESPSFSDLNLPPVPSTWKGECQEGEAFNASSCNRKVIGARYYLSGFEAEEGYTKINNFRSPRDSSGHGCHTSSIAAGRYVKNMNFNGLAAGGARGGAPLARIVAYKTCWDSGCYDVDILAAFDDAIKDGVDILSISLGPDAPQGDYFKDAISIGSFHAVSHGIVVVSSVGNERNEGSATNVAPWIITVSASSTDRDFCSEIILGKRTTYTGESLTKREINASTRIISASEAFSGYFTPYQSSYCLESSLDNTKASGKVLVCRHAESSFESKLAKSVVVKKAGGVGMILIDEEDQDVAIPFVIPAAIVGMHIGDRILSYVNSSRKPTARILSSKTVLGSRPAPRVASFSSRGPNALTPEILKPDVTAPGLNILAAWSPANGNMHFNILSGTSMACPHATGIVALIKAVHPSWSPSAIKSAIMTTAMVLDKKWKHITVDPTGRRGNPFDFGAGFLNPTRVLNPGLIYDAQPEDYKAFLCSVGYDEKSLHLVTGDNSTCYKKIYRSATDLNYPSISVPNLRDSYSVTRTLTNVGRPRSIYKAFWSSPVGINVTVSPKMLVFNNYGEKVNFTLTFKVIAPSKGYLFGSLTWRRGKLRVSSPLVVRVVSSDSGLLR
ncbi:hypothetical protein Scep_010437 [Stephania cephalantha]|uniref:Uncharacterized protein n=1 Tax=Stephania cephalantha TaxID=152367 RepID=A0AAP0PH86_9MAGN